MRGRLKVVFLWFAVIVGLSSQIARAGEGQWMLLQSNVATKTYTVNMTLHSQKNGHIIWADGTSEAGCSTGHGTITLPGAGTISVKTYCGVINPNNFEDISFWTPGKIYWCIDQGVADYAARDGSSQTHKVQLVETGSSVTFSVKVEGQVDRYARLDLWPISEDEPWHPGRFRWHEAANVMPITNMIIEDRLIYPTITISLGDQSTSYVGYTTTDDTISITGGGSSPQQLVPELEPLAPDVNGNFPTIGVTGTWDGAYDTYGNTFVEGSYSRTGGVAQESRSFSKSVNLGDNPSYIRKKAGDTLCNLKATVGGGSFSIAGGYQNGAPDSTHAGAENTGLCRFTFDDYCGQYDVNYSADINNIDGRTRSDLKTVGVEQHPIRRINSNLVGDFPVYEFAWENNFIDLSSGPNIHYGGYWEASVGGPYIASDVYDPTTGRVRRQKYIDLPAPPLGNYNQHGFAQAWNVIDRWNESTQRYRDNPPGEPSHPSWQPLPDQAVGEGGILQFQESGEPVWAQPPWCDSEVLLKGPATAPDALQLHLAGYGDVPDPPLDFYELQGWVTTGGTSSKESPFLVIDADQSGNTSAVVSNLLPQNIRLTGTRFAKVRWYASEDNAEVDFSIGGQSGWNSWKLIGGQAGNQTSTIDLCTPDESTVEGITPPLSDDSPTGTVTQTITTSPVTSENEYTTITAPPGTVKVRLYFSWIGSTTVCVCDEHNVPTTICVGSSPGPVCSDWIDLPSNVFNIFSYAGQGFSIYKYEYISMDNKVMQSIIPYDQPLDRSGVNSTRQSNEYYQWEYPAGWGVGRVASVKLECKKRGTTYKFQSLQLHRKAPADGGFAKLYVLPHQPSWNDTRSREDWAWFQSGYTGVRNNQYVIRKAHLVIDGAVVMEFPAATCEERVNTGGIFSPHYIYNQWKLLPQEGSTGMHVLAYPVDDYVNPQCYAVNGVASISVNLDNACDFIKENCYTTYLVGGTYSEDSSNNIKVDLDIDPNGMAIARGTLGTMIKGMAKRLRGGVQGLVLKDDGKPAANQLIHVETPDAPAGQKTDTNVITNAIGWYETPAVNTKGRTQISSMSTGLGEIITRNRFISRLVVQPKAHQPLNIVSICPDGEQLEPVFGDELSIWWQSDYTNAQSFLVLQQATNGAISGSEGVKYNFVDEIPIQRWEADPDYNAVNHPYRWQGRVIWTPPGAPGDYCIGVKYADGTVQTKWGNWWPTFTIATVTADRALKVPDWQVDGGGILVDAGSGDSNPGISIPGYPDMVLRIYGNVATWSSSLGGGYCFKKETSGSWTCVTDPFITLTEESANTASITTSDGSKLVYMQDPRTLNVGGLVPKTVAYMLTDFIEPSQRLTHFENNTTTAQLESVVLPDGRTYQYEYDSYGRLPSIVTDPDGRKRIQLQYGSAFTPDFPTKIIIGSEEDPKNISEESFTYNKFGKVTSITGDDGLKALVSYQSGQPVPGTPCCERVNMVRMLSESEQKVYWQTGYEYASDIVDGVSCSKTTIRDYADTGTMFAAGSAVDANDRREEFYYYIDQQSRPSFLRRDSLKWYQDSEEHDDTTTYTVNTTYGDKMYGSLMSVKDSMQKPVPFERQTSFDYYIPDTTYNVSDPDAVPYTSGGNVNGNGLLRQVTLPTNHTIGYSYQVANGVMKPFLTRVMDTNGDKVRMDVDSIGNVAGVYEQVEVNPSEWKPLASFDYWGTTEQNQALRGVLKSVTAYDATDPTRNVQTRYDYRFNSGWKMSAYTDGTASHSQFNKLDELTSTDYKSRRTYFSPDSLGRISNVKLPILKYFDEEREAKTARAEYSAHRLEYVVDPNGDQVYYGYDGLNRVDRVWTNLTGQSAYSPLVKYSYAAPFGELDHSSTYSNSATERRTDVTYDSLGRVIEVKHPEALLVYSDYFQYRDDGLILAELTGWVTAENKVQEGKVTVYEYDNLDRLTKVRYDYYAGESEANRFWPVQSIIIPEPALKNRVVKYEYLAGSDLVTSVTETIDNVLATSEYEYYKNGLLKSYEPGVPAGYGKILYTWDSLGRKESMNVPLGYSDQARTYKYNYDAQGRCIGGLSFNTAAVSQTTLEVPNDGERDDAGKTRFFYDDNGNRVKLINKAGHVFYFVYDPTASVPAVVYEQGPAAGVDSPAAGARYLNLRYQGGALARRVKFVEDLNHVVTQSTDRTYHFDGLGNTIALTNENGIITDHYTYDEWGNVLTHTDPNSNDLVPLTVDNPYQYVGQLGYYNHYQEANLGLLQVGVRYYDPINGRFTQLDPIGDGLNWYGYTGGNPLCYVDPWGLAGKQVEGWWTAFWTDGRLRGGVFKDSIEGFKGLGDGVVGLGCGVILMLDAATSGSTESNQILWEGLKSMPGTLAGAFQLDDNRKAAQGLVAWGSIYVGARTTVPGLKGKVNGGKTPEGMGVYKDVKGHHPHAKAAFENVTNYDSNAALTIGKDFLRKQGWDHNAITAEQMRLYKQLKVSGRNITWKEMERIEVKAMEKGNVPTKLARKYVKASHKYMRSKGVKGPTRIPWDK